MIVVLLHVFCGLCFNPEQFFQSLLKLPIFECIYQWIDTHINESYVDRRIEHRPIKINGPTNVIVKKYDLVWGPANHVGYADDQKSFDHIFSRLFSKVGYSWLGGRGGGRNF